MKQQLFVVFSFLSIACSASAADPARYEGPIIDVHLHAAAADMNGPPPVALCVGVGDRVKYDGKQPWPAVLMKRFKNPPCKNPIWSPQTDEEVRKETIAVMRSRNIRGLLSARPEELDLWMKEGADLFLPTRTFALGIDSAKPEDLRREFKTHGYKALAEVTSQYGGVLADDPAFEPYWEMAEDMGIPVGLHMFSGGPVGSYALAPKLRIQSPIALQEALFRHPNLRVYIMHAGYPYLEDLKAMLYLFPLLYVETGVLHFALPRAEYYRFLEALVTAGFSDRIMYGTDQMNWPGAIALGIDAINDAPFLSYDEKKAILYDNAARFFGLQD